MASWPRLNVHQQRRVTRLRRIGACLFAACIGLAIVIYRLGVAHDTPSMEELLPGSAAVAERQRYILFGRTGVSMFRWFEALQEPAGQAGLVVAAGLIAAAACYQVAHRIEVEEG
jgi:hypothetical protein